MKYCYGVVEDRADPLKIGRVRVRVRGYHTADKQFIATPDLAWSHVIMPVTTSGLTPFGSNHSLVEGTDVFGFFRDTAATISSPCTSLKKQITAASRTSLLM